MTLKSSKIIIILLMILCISPILAVFLWTPSFILAKPKTYFSSVNGPQIIGNETKYNFWGIELEPVNSRITVGIKLENQADEVMLIFSDDLNSPLENLTYFQNNSLKEYLVPFSLYILWYGISTKKNLRCILVGWTGTSGEGIPFNFHYEYFDHFLEKLNLFLFFSILFFPVLNLGILIFINIKYDNLQ